MLLLLLALALPDRVAARAHASVGLQSVHQLSREENDDCSGFARAVFAREGVDLSAVPAGPGENGVRIIRRLAGPLHRTPRRGDLVFFRNTTRRGGLSHVGIVDWVGPQGEATFVHRIHAGIVRSRLDLRHPHRRATNDVLRKYPRRLASELFAGFGSPVSAASAARRAPPLRWRSRSSRRAG